MPDHHHNHFNNNNHEQNENHRNNEHNEDVARRHAHNNLRLPLADPLPVPVPPNQNIDNEGNNNAQDFENINNDDFIDPNDPNFDNMNEADLQEANVEIRLAIFEILGVEGPFHLMFRNSFWLLGFCALYLFFTAMVPYMIGTLLSKLVVVYVGRYEALLVPQSVRSMYALIVQHSADTVPLQFLDFFYIFGGCCGKLFLFVLFCFSLVNNDCFFNVLCIIDMIHFLSTPHLTRFFVLFFTQAFSPRCFCWTVSPRPCCC